MTGGYEAIRQKLIVPIFLEEEIDRIPASIVGMGFGPVACGPHVLPPAPMPRRASLGRDARYWATDVIFDFAEYSHMPVFLCILGTFKRSCTQLVVILRWQSVLPGYRLQDGLELLHIGTGCVSWPSREFESIQS